MPPLEFDIFKWLKLRGLGMPATSVTQYQDLEEEKCSELTVIAEISCDYQANLDLLTCYVCRLLSGFSAELPQPPETLCPRPPSRDSQTDSSSEDLNYDLSNKGIK